MNEKKESSNANMFDFILCRPIARSLRVFDCYAKNDQFVTVNNRVRVERLKLFMKPKNENKKSNIKLVIRFANQGMLSKHVRINCVNNTKIFVGFPLVLYIHKSDTLQQIIDEYINYWAMPDWNWTNLSCAHCQKIGIYLLHQRRGETIMTTIHTRNF